MLKGNKFKPLLLNTKLAKQFLFRIHPSLAMDRGQLAEIQPGSVLFSRFEIVRKLGVGSFGAVFEAIDKGSGQRVAVKLELKKYGRYGKKEAILKEAKVIEAMQGVHHFLEYYGCGKQYDCHYIVMELADASVAKLLQRSEMGKFSLSTSAYFAYNFVEALKELHKAGFIHRDVKPANFVVKRIGMILKVYLTDFGTAKRIENYRETVKLQSKVPFVGSTNYSSPNVHMGKPYGPVDDLFSVFYSFLKISTGTLPWCGRLKSIVAIQKFCISPTELIGCKPETVYQIYEKLRSLTYDDELDYDWFIDKFKSLMISDLSPIEEIFESFTA
ncbi:Tau-tubulin kinase 1 [Trichinella britovi]|uniref:non-specific serine/threonine protein kinase n=1 Tax=Trichinella britovi TaxID=45882 RepID=A0A0V1D2T2_TRIBR|nr:Tau-tubulin kinase 1 [Trichinella britovi]